MHSEWRITVLTLSQFSLSTSIITLSGLPIGILVCAEVPKCLWLVAFLQNQVTILLFYYNYHSESVVLFLFLFAVFPHNNRNK